ncbi:MAG: helix-turn-helix domain-containing protein [Ruminococcaceae bacterium]|nr:helix-turn-helix domain-containing protein [Oscillospiraceae bacterium]
MPLRLNTKEMEDLLRSFYTLSGIRLVLFDTAFREVISYPTESSPFCQMMKACPQTRRKCTYADHRSFEKCEKTNALVLYKCHAGLVEAVIPLHESEKIIGYLMFGQITDSAEKTALLSYIELCAQKYHLDETALRESLQAVTYRSEEQIHAAAKILEACTSYILYRELIEPENDRLISAAKAYIDAHLGEEFSVDALCRELNMGRTRLYELFKAQTKMGVAAYLRRRRVHKAKQLLKSTDMSVQQIAQAVGFADYNYFSRVFKKAYGRPPKSYR